MEILESYNMEPYFEPGKERRKKRTRLKSKKTRMGSDQVKEITTFLREKYSGNRNYHYFKDRYALMLLSWYVGAGKSVREIKQSPYGKLLNKPVVKYVLARSGSTMLTSDDLDSVWPPLPECFTVGIGDWGQSKGARDSYYQTSRPGKNLLLVLNFSNMHDNVFKKLVPERFVPYFRYLGHPHAKGRYTLAWARIDIAEDMSEALVEEIQNDWLREARFYLAQSERGCKPKNANPKQHREMMRYAGAVLERYLPIWSEALLAFVIKMLKEDLLIDEIFYHSFESGNLLKGFDESDHPPRSLYTQLPRQFCFQPTEPPPRMLEHEMERLHNKRKLKSVPLFNKLQW